MIHTDIDIKDELWRWVSDSPLASVITGGVYKDQRPLNSEVEDIVIAVIARTAGSQMQQATANVNIYVADKRRGKETIEDTQRLRTLCTEAASLFEYKNTGDAIYELDSQEVMKVYGADWHIINNQISIRYNNET